jgi:indolepyruvate ferredoxin oxidoreductase alpha subunit
MNLLQKEGKKLLLLGNEAVVRGALEAGLKFATTYPGTPASEIGDTLAKIAKDSNIYFEYSSNEKIALEAAAGAAFCGLKAMVSMKHYGLNVALDSLLPLIYLECPLVLVVADDPGCWSSIQTEQDSRWISYLGKIPTLEPSDSQEVYEMTKFAFKLAFKYKIPVLIRLTTRVSHTRSLVKTGRLIFSKEKLEFVKKKFSIGRELTINRHKDLLKKIEKIKNEISEKTKFNFSLKRKSDLGIIVSGVSYYYLLEILKELNLNLPILKIGLSYPLPERKIKNFLKNLSKVLIIEEIDPIIEKGVKEIANKEIKIFGKDLIPQFGEVKPENILFALKKLIPKIKIELNKFEILVEKRFPNLCPGCPHRATYWSVKQALKELKIKEEEVVFGGDIGCYLLYALPPYNLADYIVAMGAGMGISHGISKVTLKKPIIFIGDSTFFHAGLPALANLVYNKADVLLIILDNKTTAMTGHQPHPGTSQTGMGEETKNLKIEEIVKSFQVDKLEVINVYNLNDSILKIKEAYQVRGVSVIVAKGECRLLTVRKMARAGIRIPKFEIVKQSENLEILKDFNCPAISKNKEGKYIIDENLCWGCGFCTQILKDYIQPKKYENI